MRKALAFIIVLLVFCCSVSASLGSEKAVAVEGAYDGLISSMAAYLSEPRITLQGVNVVNGDGVVPSLISFVRSDVSTYAGSLSFFGAGVNYGVGVSDAYSDRTQTNGLLRSHLNKHGYNAGDIILDGSVRLDRGGTTTRLEMSSNPDWRGFRADITISFMVTGAMLEHGYVIEGTLVVQRMTERRVTISAENLKVNNEVFDIEPITIVFGS